jgi:hypothetical protein
MALEWLSLHVKLGHVQTFYLVGESASPVSSGFVTAAKIKRQLAPTWRGGPTMGLLRTKRSRRKNRPE